MGIGTKIVEDLINEMYDIAINGEDKLDELHGNIQKYADKLSYLSPKKAFDKEKKAALLQDSESFYSALEEFTQAKNEYFQYADRIDLIARNHTFENPENFKKMFLVELFNHFSFFSPQFNRAFSEHSYYFPVEETPLPSSGNFVSSTKFDEGKWSKVFKASVTDESKDNLTSLIFTCGHYQPYLRPANTVSEPNGIFEGSVLESLSQEFHRKAPTALKSTVNAYNQTMPYLDISQEKYNNMIDKIAHIREFKLNAFTKKSAIEITGIVDELKSETNYEYFVYNVNEYMTDYVQTYYPQLKINKVIVSGYEEYLNKDLLFLSADFQDTSYQITSYFSGQIQKTKHVASYPIEGLVPSTDNTIKFEFFTDNNFDPNPLGMNSSLQEKIFRRALFKENLENELLTHMTYLESATEYQKTREGFDNLRKIYGLARKWTE